MWVPSQRQARFILLEPNWAEKGDKSAGLLLAPLLLQDSFRFIGIIIPGPEAGDKQPSAEPPHVVRGKDVFLKSPFLDMLGGGGWVACYLPTVGGCKELICAPQRRRFCACERGWPSASGLPGDAVGRGFGIIG